MNLQLAPYAPVKKIRAIISGLKKAGQCLERQALANLEQFSVYGVYLSHAMVTLTFNHSTNTFGIQ